MGTGAGGWIWGLGSILMSNMIGAMARSLIFLMGFSLGGRGRGRGWGRGRGRGRGQWGKGDEEGEGMTDEVEGLGIGIDTERIEMRGGRRDGR